MWLDGIASSLPVPLVALNRIACQNKDDVPERVRSMFLWVASEAPAAGFPKKDLVKVVNLVCLRSVLFMDHGT